MLVRTKLDDVLIVMFSLLILVSVAIALYLYVYPLAMEVNEIDRCVCVMNDMNRCQG